jgi:MFS family permease
MSPAGHGGRHRGSFTVAQAVLVGLLGSAAAFAPLVADTSLWFVKRRGIAVAVCASGNYVAGAIWPPVAQHFIETVGWRQTYIGMGIFCGSRWPRSRSSSAHAHLPWLPHQPAMRRAHRRRVT